MQLGKLAFSSAMIAITAAISIWCTLLLVMADLKERFLARATGGASAENLTASSRSRACDRQIVPEHVRGQSKYDRQFDNQPGAVDGMAKTQRSLACLKIGMKQPPILRCDNGRVRPIRTLPHRSDFLVCCAFAHDHKRRPVCGIGVQRIGGIVHEREHGAP
jgi:hypothetical protein